MKKIQSIILGTCCLFVQVSAFRMMFEVAKDINNFTAFVIFSLILAFQILMMYLLSWLCFQDFKKSFNINK